MKTLLSSAAFNTAIDKLGAAICDQQSDYQNLAFVGIHTRGVPLAKRLTAYFHKQNKPVLQGLLDINL
ncbi:MAG TPA: bifunctional pyr operon transcriptional regulator/uracil phosphoribosyltransferase, partial [bacterium]|nr:bifunctional pyr operon transcriptional regulator/uracil phosphoribosyltransferase [bacterium]